jgi:hypothetical protein
MERRKIPTPVPSTNSTKANSFDISKWVPLICAGSAIGIGLFALKEIKNAKKEINNNKLSQKMESLEEQLKTISTYIKNKDKIPEPIQRKNKGPIKLNVEPEKIVVINQEDEYEEVEVTDSEAESDSEN